MCTKTSLLLCHMEAWLRCVCSCALRCVNTRARLCISLWARWHLPVELHAISGAELLTASSIQCRSLPCPPDLGRLCTHARARALHRQHSTQSTRRSSCACSPALSVQVENVTGERWWGGSNNRLMDREIIFSGLGDSFGRPSHFIHSSATARSRGFEGPLGSFAITSPTLRHEGGAGDPPCSSLSSPLGGARKAPEHPASFLQPNCAYLCGPGPWYRT
jgi:hypothetical protein